MRFMSRGRRLSTNSSKESDSRDDFGTIFSANNRFNPELQFKKSEHFHCSHNASQGASAHSPCSRPHWPPESRLAGPDTPAGWFFQPPGPWARPVQPVGTPNVPACRYAALQGTVAATRARPAIATAEATVGEPGWSSMSHASTVSSRGASRRDGSLAAARVHRPACAGLACHENGPCHMRQVVVVDQWRSTTSSGMRSYREGHLKARFREVRRDGRVHCTGVLLMLKIDDPACACTSAPPMTPSHARTIGRMLHPQAYQSSSPTS